jgi:hypothetical protein
MLRQAAPRRPALDRNLHDAIKVTHLHKVLEILPDVPAALRSVEGTN